MLSSPHPLSTRPNLPPVDHPKADQLGLQEKATKIKKRKKKQANHVAGKASNQGCFLTSLSMASGLTAGIHSTVERIPVQNSPEWAIYYHLAPNVLFGLQDSTVDCFSHWTTAFNSLTSIVAQVVCLKEN